MKERYIDKMNTLSTKNEFIREFSSRSGFNLQDSQAALNTFITIFEDGCRDLVEIDIQGLGKLRHTLIESHKGNKPTPGQKGKKQEIDIPESTRTTFVLSKQLKNLSKSE